MKTLIGVIATGLITAMLLNNFPWWSCGIIAFVVAFALRFKAGAAFLSGFTGVALAWGLIAGWIDSQNAGVLSGRIGELFGGLSSALVVLITTVIGGLIGGLGGISGAALAQMVFGRKTN
jgi:hypothetical protein